MPGNVHRQLDVSEDRMTTTDVRRGRGVSAGLTRDRVIAAAERVIDADGFDALSFRRLAAELGVSPTAIYHHVADRSELIDGVADAFVQREMLDGLPTGLTPIDTVRELARRVHRAGSRHPGLLLAIVGHRPERTTAQHEFGEVLIENVLRAGGTEAQAQLVYRVIVSLAAGAAIGLQNVSRETATPLEERTARQRDASERPEAARILNSLPPLGDEAAYEAQIELALSGLTGRAS
jgi:AcrR family transcriptional regulator